jgi:hypothetical protein
LFGIKETEVDVTEYWMVRDKDGTLVQGTERGHYNHVYESTAAYGATVFWKYGQDFPTATDNAVKQ